MLYKTFGKKTNYLNDNCLHRHLREEHLIKENPFQVRGRMYPIVTLMVQKTVVGRMVKATYLTLRALKSQILMEDFKHSIIKVIRVFSGYLFQLRTLALNF